MSRNKYFAKKNQKNDSKGEAKRAAQLKLLERIGKVSNLKEQVSFVILESFKDSAGKTERGIKYVADFVYFDEEIKKHIIEDYKSSFTAKLPVYIMKRKFVKKLYPKYIFKEYIK